MQESQFRRLANRYCRILVLVFGAAALSTSTPAAAQGFPSPCAMAYTCWFLSTTPCSNPVGDGKCHASYTLRYECPLWARIDVEIANGWVDDASHVMGAGLTLEVEKDITPNSSDVDAYVASMQCCDGNYYDNCAPVSLR